MFPAPPFSMFRYARQVRQVPGSVHVPDSWRSDPRMDSDDGYAYMPGELGLFLEKSDIVSFSPDDSSIIETSFWRQVSNN